MKTLQEVLAQKYPTGTFLQKKWYLHTNTQLAWEHLTQENIEDFVLGVTEDVSRSSARQYCARLKSCIEPYANQVSNLPQNWRKLLVVRDDESQQIYLSEAEIQRIIEYKPDTQTEALVQQQFILGCLTGARHSDYSRFNEANINAEGNLIYVSRKTHTVTEVPLSPVAKAILLPDKDTPYANAYKGEVCDNTFNNTIRRICDMCDINDEVHLYRRGKFWKGKKWRAVSSHTSRRSFATNLYLRCRDLYLVSQLCGHSSTTMTERYICCMKESLTEQAMAYFSTFKQNDK